MKTLLYNDKGKDWIVGDVHGMFSLLTDLLLEREFNFDNDRLIATGDLVDRGPESHLALDWLSYPWFYSVRGNHEALALDYYQDIKGPGCSSDWLYASNGGQWFIDLTKEQRRPYYEAFKDLPYRIQILDKKGNPDVGIVHAEAPEDWLRPDPEHIMLWSRNRVSLKDTKGTANIKKVFLGHTPMRKPLECGNNHYIDTGACFGHNFTIIEMEHNKL